MLAHLEALSDAEAADLAQRFGDLAVAAGSYRGARALCEALRLRLLAQRTRASLIHAAAQIECESAFVRSTDGEFKAQIQLRAGAAATSDDAEQFAEDLIAGAAEIAELEASADLLADHTPPRAYELEFVLEQIRDDATPGTAGGEFMGALVANLATRLALEVAALERDAATAGAGS